MITIIQHVMHDGERYRAFTAGKNITSEDGVLWIPEIADFTTNVLDSSLVDGRLILVGAHGMIVEFDNPSYHVHDWLEINTLSLVARVNAVCP